MILRMTYELARLIVLLCIMAVCTIGFWWIGQQITVNFSGTLEDLRKARASLDANTQAIRDLNKRATRSEVEIDVHDEKIDKLAREQKKAPKTETVVVLPLVIPTTVLQSFPTPAPTPTRVAPRPKMKGAQ